MRWPPHEGKRLTSRLIKPGREEQEFRTCLREHPGNGRVRPAYLVSIEGMPGPKAVCEECYRALIPLVGIEDWVDESETLEEDEPDPVGSWGG